MTDRTIAPPVASTASIDRTPVATTGTPLTFRTVRQRWPLLILLAVAVPLVLGALAMIDGGRLLFWDAPLTAAAVDHRSTAIDNLSLAVSRLGAWPVVYPLGGALALVAARRSPRLSWIIIATVGARPAVEWLLKEIVERPRPDGPVWSPAPASPSPAAMSWPPSPPGPSFPLSSPGTPTAALCGGHPWVSPGASKPGCTEAPVTTGRRAAAVQSSYLKRAR